MAIKPPSFNYGSGGGGNLMSAIIGAALAGNKGPSFAQQLYSQEQRQGWQDQRDLEDRIFRYQTAMQTGIASGQMMTPEDLNYPQYQGQDVRTSVMGFPGLSGFTDKQLAEMGYNDRSELQYTIVDPQSADRALSQWNPAQVRLEAEKYPFREVDATQDERGYVVANKMEDVYYAVEAADYRMVLDRLRFYGRDSDAEKLEAQWKESGGRISGIELAAYGTIGSAAAEESTVEDRDARTRAGQQQANASSMRARTDRMSLVAANSSNYTSVMSIERYNEISGEFEKDPWTFLGETERPSADEIQFLGELATEMQQAGGQDPKEILSRIITDKVELDSEGTKRARVLDFFTNYTPVGDTINRLGAGGRGRVDSPEGLVDFQTAFNTFKGSGWITSPEGVASLQNMTIAYINNPSAYAALRASHPNAARDLPPEMPGKKALLQHLTDFMQTGGIVAAGLGMALEAPGLADFYSANQFRETVQASIADTNVGRVLSPAVMHAYRTATDALGTSIISDADWEQIVELSKIAHDPAGTNWEMYQLRFQQWIESQQGQPESAGMPEYIAPDGTEPFGSTATTIIQNWDQYSAPMKLGYVTTAAQQGMSPADADAWMDLVMKIATATSGRGGGGLTPKVAPLTEMEQISLLEDALKILERYKGNLAADELRGGFYDIVMDWADGTIDLVEEWQTIRTAMRYGTVSMRSNDPNSWDPGWVAKEVREGNVDQYLYWAGTDEGTIPAGRGD